MPAAKPTPGTLHEEIDLEPLMGSTWAGFMLLPGNHTNQYQGKFLHAYWRRPFDIGELCSMFYTSNEVHTLRHEVKQLRKEIEAAQAAADLTEEKMQFYRQELRAVSRLGLMFCALLEQ
jgi:hypothetical protein